MDKFDYISYFFYTGNLVSYNREVDNINSLSDYLIYIINKRQNIYVPTLRFFTVLKNNINNIIPGIIFIINCVEKFKVFHLFQISQDKYYRKEYNFNNINFDGINFDFLDIYNNYTNFIARFNYPQDFLSNLFCFYNGEIIDNYKKEENIIKYYITESKFPYNKIVRASTNYFDDFDTFYFECSREIRLSLLFSYNSVITFNGNNFVYSNFDHNFSNNFIYSRLFNSNIIIIFDLRTRSFTFDIIINELQNIVVSNFIMIILNNLVNNTPNLYIREIYNNQFSYYITKGKKIYFDTNLFFSNIDFNNYILSSKYNIRPFHNNQKSDSIKYIKNITNYQNIDEDILNDKQFYLFDERDVNNIILNDDVNIIDYDSGLFDVNSNTLVIKIKFKDHLSYKVTNVPINQLLGQNKFNNEFELYITDIFQDY